MKLKVNDQVVVIAGKDKGKVGEIMFINKAKERVVVKGINLITKHIKATPQRPGQKIQTEASIHASNVMLLCPKTKKRTRVAYQKADNGKKERIAKVSGETIDKKTAKK